LSSRTTDAAAVHYRISAESPPVATRLRELWDARDLFVLLVGREIKVRYKQTALGVAWVVVQPLVPAIIIAVVLGTFARLPSAGQPYLLFALSGFVVFGLFASAVSRAATAFIRDGQLVTRIYFPRALLPLASGSASIVDFAVSFVVLIALMFLLGQTPTPGIAAVPLVALLTIGLALALGLAISALSAHYRDFALAVPFVLQLLLYASPVVYSMELVPASIRPLYSLNPLVPLIEGFRSALLGTPGPTGLEILGAAVTGSAVAAIGILVFMRASRDIADVI